MFGRKIDPHEQEEILRFFREVTGWSREIDSAVDKVKIAFLGMGSSSTSEEVISLVNKALKTVGKVKSKATNETDWPNLEDNKGHFLLTDFWVKRENTFKHQLYRLTLIAKVAGATSQYEETTLIQEALAATSQYEKSVNDMTNSGVKLLKRYKIPPQAITEMMFG